MIANPPDAEARVATPAEVAKHFRRLKADELVSQGDFVADGHCGFAPWEGPGGFRADSFVKPIYRKLGSRPIGNKKSA